MARRDWSNRALPSISQATDMIVRDVQHKQDQARQDKIRQEGFDREDQKHQATQKMGILSQMLQEPGITDESKAKINEGRLGLITSPEMDISGYSAEQQMVPVPPEWDKYMNGYFSRQNLNQIPKQQWMKFKELYDVEMDDQNKNSQNQLDRESRERIASMRASRTSKDELAKMSLRERRAKLQEYLEGARGVAEAGGFPKYDENGMQVGVDPVDQDMILDYIRNIDDLDKKAVTDKWSDTEDDAFMKLTNFLDYYNEKGKAAKWEATARDIDNRPEQYGQRGFPTQSAGSKSPQSTLKRIASGEKAEAQGNGYSQMSPLPGVLPSLSTQAGTNKKKTNDDDPMDLMRFL